MNLENDQVISYLCNEVMMQNKDKDYSLKDLTDLAVSKFGEENKESTIKVKLYSAFKDGTYMHGCGRVGRGRYQFTGAKSATKQKKVKKVTMPKVTETDSKMDIADKLLESIGLNPQEYVLAKINSQLKTS